MSRVESAVVVDAEGLSFRARLEPAEGGAQVLLEAVLDYDRRRAERRAEVAA